MRSPVAAIAAAASRGLARVAGSAGPGGALLENRSPTPYVARRDMAGQGLDGGVFAGGLGGTAANGTLYSIINTLSTGLASIPWHLHTTMRVRAGTTCPVCDEEGVRMVPNHPALKVLDRPNDFFTRQELFESVQQHIDLVGEGWMTVAWSAGRPVELWPVRPDRMAPVRDPDEYLTGYVYRSPDGQLIPLKRNEVIFIRVPSPLDPYRGMGAVQTIVNQIYGARYAAEWNRRFFENSALPDGIIEIPNHLSDPEFEEFQDRFFETHKGVSNAHTVGMLEHGAKWVETKYTKRDMEFSELGRATREEIREAFGIHGHKLGLSETVNRANAEAADYAYAKDKMVPRADRWAGALNNDFLRLFNDIGMGEKQGYEFCYESPVPEDREADNAERTSKAQAFSTLIAAGCDPTYAASVVGLPPPEMAAVAPSAPAAGAAAPGEAAPAEQEDGANDEPPAEDSRQGGSGSDGAAMDTLRTWAPVKLGARSIPAMLNSIHDGVRSSAQRGAEVSRGR